MGSRGGIVDEQREDKIYVCVGKVVKESQKTLVWALNNSGGRKICILHVHQPPQKIPIMGTKFPISQLGEHQVRAFHESERRNMQKVLEKYRKTCERAGVQAEKLHIEMESVEKGIVELISQHGIRRLVMGAAADKLYTKKMMEPKSKKAIYVRLQAPVSCHIWFICKGNIIDTREGRSDRVNVGVASPSLQASPNTETGPFESLRSRSVTEEDNGQLKLTISDPYYNHRIKIPAFSSRDGAGVVTPHNRLIAERTFDERDGASRRSQSLDSRFSASSSEVDESSLLSYLITEGSEKGIELIRVPHSREDLHLSSPPSVQEGSMYDKLYDQIEQAMAEAEKSRREAYEESIRRRKAEKDASEAIRRAKASESSYAEEFRQRRELEEALARGKEELEKIKPQLDAVMKELQVSREQKSNLEIQIADSDRKVQELEQKIFSAVELLQNLKKERDELQVERENALRVAEERREKQAEEATSPIVTQFFSEFSFSEIEEATRNFDPTLKIGEGGYGSIYRGLLRHTQVAIKMLHSQNLQGPLEFQQEVNILSKLRHPNLVTLIGACPEAWTLIYEYLPNGSLEDHLNCKDNTPPLSWQTRIRIATEMCCVLIFLQSCRPHSIIHGDLKPDNILLDANSVSRLSDFGLSRILPLDEFSSKNTTLCCRTDPKGTFVYMDPEFLATGDLTPKSDVYSFGLVMLRLLTGRPALGIIKEVKDALDKGDLKNLLDPAAGDWPFIQAKQLAHLAISCCDMDSRNRPDFVSEVWRVLEPMRVSCGASSFQLGSEERCQIPTYFICPIFQELMQDPVVAADGFTYEAEALKGWLDSGHGTSPMTNLQLPNCNLLPNRALRSAIQEWLQQP